MTIFSKSKPKNVFNKKTHENQGNMLCYIFDKNGIQSPTTLQSKMLPFQKTTFYNGECRYGG